MATELRRPVRPTTPADLHRLAAQGEAKGVQLFQAQATGAWFATSISHPGELHALTGYSCDCPGFLYAGRCMHHALLLARLGWLPALDDAPATIPCPDCAGKGWTYQEVNGGRAWPDRLACRRCDGAGRLPVVIRALPANVPALAAD